MSFIKWLVFPMYLDANFILFVTILYYLNKWIFPGILIKFVQKEEIVYGSV